MAPSAKVTQFHSLYTRKLWITPTGRMPCINAANIGERKTWTQNEVWTWQTSVRGKSQRKCIYSVYTSPRDGQATCKVWLASGERRRCSNEAKTRNALKFTGVPQTYQLVGRSLPYCEDIWRRYCYLTAFFPIVDTCLHSEDIARQSCAMAIFWRFFASCIFSEPLAAHFRHAF